MNAETAADAFEDWWYDAGIRPVLASMGLGDEAKAVLRQAFLAGWERWPSAISKSS